MVKFIAIGDWVIYSQNHYLWLVQADRWPSKRLSRRMFTGRVVGGNGQDSRGFLCVRWIDNTVTWHLFENLERLEGG